VSDAVGISKTSSILQRSLQVAAGFLLVSALPACDAKISAYEDLQNPVAPLLGPPVTRNTTPIDPAFTCMASRIKHTGRRGLRIGVGEVLDLTGKYIEAEGGGIVTKGGAHMVMSALGKLDDSIVLVERVSPEIAERELAYMDRRQLGDGDKHEVPGEADLVPWLPYFGGTVLKSDYYIIGAITELNFNISSSGAEVTLRGFGVQKSKLTMNVAVDLRIVDTQSLNVAGTTSLQKQIVGEEIGADVFRFFGDYLFDLNTGRRAQEPVQLAVRTTLELAVLEMISEVTRTDDAPCVTAAEAAMIDNIAAARVDPVVTPPAAQARRAVGSRT